MSDRLFARKAFQPPGMEKALVISVGLVFISATASIWANGFVGGLFFVLTEYGWATTDGGKDVLHPGAHKLALTARYLTVVPPLISLFWGIGSRAWGKWRAKYRMSNHTVVCGFGWQGRAYVRSLHSRNMPVVAVEVAADEMAKQLCDKKRAILIYGNADDPEVLRSTGIEKAKDVFICTGSQDQNLSIAKTVAEVMQKMPKRDNPLQVHVSLGELPIDDSDTDQLFFPLLQSGDNCHFDLYDPDRRMARCFYYRHKVYQWADEQYENRRWIEVNTLVRDPAKDASESSAGNSDDIDQSYRVHLVFLGYTRLVGELILQYARIWPSVNQLPPYFTVICENSSEADAFVSRYRWLAPELDIENSDNLKPGTVFVHNREAHTHLLDEALMKEVEDRALVTSVVCSNTDIDTGIQHAGYCKVLANQFDLWQVPVFADLEKREGTDGLLEIGESLSFASERIIPFGSALHYCDTGLLSYADKLAREIHHAYVVSNESKDVHGNILPAYRDWAQLDQRYQRSNYRAADAALLKLYSSGLRWNSVTPGALIGGFNDTDEILSENEHRSWVHEKLLDHWSHGENRDEQRRLHPNIDTWKALDPETKNKDKDQIATLKAQFESRATTAGKPLCIGVVGPTNLHKWQAYSCTEQLKKKLDELTDFKEMDTVHWVDLVSPLAPGSDMILIDQLVTLLRQPKYPVAGVRLLIPYVLPWQEVEDSFRLHWEAGIQWLFDNTKYSYSGNSSEWSVFKDEIIKTREGLFTKMRESRFPVETIDLRPEVQTGFDKDQAYQLATRWIIDKAEVLIGVTEPKVEYSDTPEFDNGFSSEVLRQWNNKGQLITIDSMQNPV